MKVLFGKLNEKTKQYELITEKLTSLFKKKKALERQINLMLSNPSELPINTNERTKSQPKMRKQPNISIEKGQISGLYTERNEYIEEDYVQRLRNQLNVNKTKKSNHEKSISHDFTTKKTERTELSFIEDGKEHNKSKCKNQRECSRHQKSYRFNLEDASAKDIELLDTVKNFILFFFLF